MDQAAFFRTLSAFLSERHNKPILIEAGTDLFATGAVDSLTMIDILMLIEELSGRSIELDELDPALFEDSQALYQAFFQDEALT